MRMGWSRWAAVGLMLVVGCTPAGREKWHRRTDRRSARELLDAALHDPRPDQRRRAIELLADSSAGKADSSQKAFDTIARTDSDGMVRAAAVRGLRRSDSAAPVATLVKLLDSLDRQMADTLPAPPAVRWEAVLLLDHLARAGDLSATDREAALVALAARVEHDPDRNVRLAAVEALKRFHDRRALPVLVNAMRTRDFTLQVKSEETLHALTGQSHDHDADAWEQWLSQAKDPLAGGVEHPAEKRGFWSRLRGR